jgi:hypothetical protein
MNRRKSQPVPLLHRSRLITDWLDPLKNRVYFGSSRVQRVTGLLRHHGVVCFGNWRPVDDRVSLLPFGFTISLPDLLSVLISLSLLISFSVGQRKTRKINERKKEAKDNQGGFLVFNILWCREPGTKQNCKKGFCFNFFYLIKYKTRSQVPGYNRVL